MTIPAQAVYIPALNLHGFLVRVVPSDTALGETDVAAAMAESAWQKRADEQMHKREPEQGEEVE
jgi:hypothetical protein